MTSEQITTATALGFVRARTADALAIAHLAAVARDVPPLITDVEAAQLQRLATTYRLSPAALLFAAQWVGSDSPLPARQDCKAVAAQLYTPQLSLL